MRQEKMHLLLVSYSDSHCIILKSKYKFGKSSKFVQQAALYEVTQNMYVMQVRPLLDWLAYSKSTKKHYTILEIC